MSEARTGKKQSPETILKRRETMGLGKVIVNGVEYASFPDADRKLGLGPGTTRGRVASSSAQFSGYTIKNKMNTQLEADCKTVKPHYQKLKEQVHVG